MIEWRMRAPDGKAGKQMTPRNTTCWVLLLLLLLAYATPPASPTLSPTADGRMILAQSRVEYANRQTAGTQVLTISPQDASGNIAGSTYDPNVVWAQVCREPVENVSSLSLLTYCVYPNYGQVEQGASGDYEISLSLLIVGTYYVYIYHTQSADKLSEFPIELHVTEGQYIGSQSTVQFTADPWYVDRSPAHFYLITKDTYTNHLTTGGRTGQISVTTSPATVDETGYSPGPIEIIDIDDTGWYRIQLTTVLAGHFQVFIEVNGREVVGSPWSLSISAADLSDQCTADYPPHVRAGERNSFLVYARDRWGNLIEFGEYSASFSMDYYVNGTKTDSAPAFRKVALGTYSCTFTAQTDVQMPSSLQVFVTSPARGLNRVPIHGSSGRVSLTTVNSEASVATSEFFFEQIQRAGEMLYGVLPYDEYSNPCTFGLPSALTAVATNELYSVQGKAIASPYQGMDGSEIVEIWNATVAGEYTVHLYLNGVMLEIPGISPVNVTINPNIISKESIVSDVANPLPIGITYTIHVEGRDQFGNSITQGGEADLLMARIENPSDSLDTISAEIADAADGTYYVSFTVRVSGLYEVQMHFPNGPHLRVQPFMSEVISATPDMYVVGGAGLNGGVVGKTLGIAISHSPHIYIMPELDAAAAFSALLIFEGSTKNLTLSPPTAYGRRDVLINETVAGAYSLSILLSGAPVAGSPYIINVVGGAPTAATQILLAQNATPGYVIKYTAGETAALYIQMRDKYGNVPSVNLDVDITVRYVKQPDNSVYLAELDAATPEAAPYDRDGVPAAFVATATLTVAGTYVINVHVLGQQRCLDVWIPGEEICIPSALVDPEQALASVSLLQGSSTRAFHAGNQVSLKVLPLDRFGNPVTYSHSADQLVYALNATMLVSSSTATPNGSRAISQQQLRHNSQDNSHELLYTLTVAGVYAVTVEMMSPRWYTETSYLVTRKALQIEVMPAEVNLDVTEVVPLNTSVGVTSVISVIIKDSYGNTIMDDLTSTLGMELHGPVHLFTPNYIIIKRLDGQYKAYFQTAVAGTYEIGVEIQGRRVSGRFFQITGGTAASSASTASGPGLQMATAGQTATFYIYPHDSYGNRLYESNSECEVTIALEDAGSSVSKDTVQLGPLDYSVMWNLEAAAYQITYYLERIGTAIITATLGPSAVGDHIRFSPFRVAVVASEPSATTSTLFGLGLNGAVVNTSGNFRIQARDRFSNKLSVGGYPFRVSGSPFFTKLAKVDTELQDQQDGTYLVTYLADTATRYDFTVLLHGEHVGTYPRSPFISVDIQAEMGPLSVFQTVAEGPNLLEAYAGSAASYTITLVSNQRIPMRTTGGVRFDVKITCRVVGDQCPFPTGSLRLGNAVRTYGMDVANVVIDNGDGTYEVNYNISAPGDYLQEVQVDFSYIAIPPGQAGWPISLQVYAAATSPAHSLLDSAYPMPSVTQANVSIPLRVLAKDGMGNAQNYSKGAAYTSVVAVHALWNGLDAGITTVSQNLSAGAYDVTLTLPHIGEYTITVTLDEQLIGTAYSPSGATYTVTVPTAPLSKAQSVAIGSGLQGTEVGKQAAVRIAAYDAAGNRLQRSQLYGVDCRAEIANLDTASDFQPLPLECQLFEDSQAIGYNITYTLLQAGWYSLAVSFNGEPTIGSPYSNICITPGQSSELATSVEGDAVNSSIAGVETVFTVIARDRYGNRQTKGGDALLVRIYPTASEENIIQIFGGVSDLENGTYSVTYTALVAGAYEVMIELNGRQVANSPYSLSVLPSLTDPRQSFVQGKDYQNVQAGRYSNLKIVSVTSLGVRQDKSIVDEWQASISPSGTTFGELTLPMQRQTDGVYYLWFAAERVIFFPNGTKQPYRIDVSLNGLPLSSSPFLAYVHAATPDVGTSTLFTLDGSIVTSSYLSAQAGMEVKLLLQLKDAFGNDVEPRSFEYGGDFQAYLEGMSTTAASGFGSADGLVVPCTVAENNIGPYEIAYNATIAGSYKFILFIGGGKWGDLELQISPAQNDPSMFILTGSGITDDVTAFQATYFHVQCRDTFGNYRVDDGLLEVTNSSSFLSVHMEVHTGSALTHDQAVDVVESVTVISRPQTPDSGRLTDGTYIVRFISHISGGVLITRIQHVQGTLRTDVADSPYTVNVLAAEVVTAELFGPVLSASTSLVPSWDPPATPNIYLYLSPQDAGGNRGVMPADVNDNGNFTVEVFPSGIATVEQPTLRADGIYQGFIQFLQLGTMTLEVKYQGSHVINSPHSLMVRPAFSFVNPTNSFADGPGLLAAVAGERSSFTVHLVTDNGEFFPMSMDNPCMCAVCPPPLPLSVEPLPERFVQVYVNSVLISATEGTGEIRDNCNGTYSVSYVVNTVGPFAIEVFVGPQDGNPNFGTIPDRIGSGDPYFTVAHAAGSTGALVEYLGSSDQGLACSGEEVLVDIRPFDAFGNKQDYLFSPYDEFQVDVTVNSIYTFQAALALQHDVTTNPVSAFLRASFIPTDMGLYVVDVYMRNNNTNMEWKPVASAKQIQVLAGQPDPTNTKVTGSGVFEASAGIVSFVHVEHRDVSGNSINDSALAYSVSPCQVALSSAGNTTEVTLVSLDDQQWPVEVIPLYDDQLGIQYFTYLATQAGYYMLQVRVQGQPVAMGDYSSTMVHAGQAYAPSCVCKGAGVGDGGQQLTAGYEAEFLITSYDKFGNALSHGGDVFHIVLKSARDTMPGLPNLFNNSNWESDGRFFINPSINDQGDGTYIVRYAPLDVAVYMVEARLGGQNLSGAPYIVNIQAGATDAANTLVFCKESVVCGLSSLEAGVRGTVFLKAQDRFANPRSDTMEYFYYSVSGGGGYSESGEAAPLGSQFPGEYSFNFNCERAGRVSMLVLHREHLLLESEVMIMPSEVDAQMSTLSGDGFPRANAGALHTLLVIARDTFSNQLSSGGLAVIVKLVENGTGRVSEVGRADQGDGTYLGHFNKTRAGNYTVEASINGMDLLPAVIEVLAGQAVPAYTLLGGGVADAAPGPYAAGQEGVLTFMVRDQFFNTRWEGSDLTLVPGADSTPGATSLKLRVFPVLETACAAKPEAVTPTIQFVANRTDTHGGKYVVRFTAQQAGVMRIVAEISGVPLHNPNTSAPFEALILPGPAKAANCVVHPRTLAVFGKPANFTVETYDAFGNALTTDTALFEVNFELNGTADPVLSNNIRNMRSTVAYLGSNVYEVSYEAPTHTTQYNLSVAISLLEGANRYKRLLPFGEFTVRGVSQAQEASPRHSVIIGLHGQFLNPSAARSMLTSAGKNLSFYVEARDVHSTPTDVDQNGRILSEEWLTIEVAPSVPMALISTTGMSSRFKVTLFSHRAGNYSVFLKAGGVLIGGNWYADDLPTREMTVQIQPSVPSAQTAEISNLSPAAVAGVESAFLVTSYDEYGNRQLHMPSSGGGTYTGTLRRLGYGGETYSLRVLDNEDGTYKMTYMVTQSGHYALTVSLRDEVLAASLGDLLKIQVSPGNVFPPACTLQPNVQPDNVRLGEALQFLIEARDVHRNLILDGKPRFALGVECQGGTLNAGTANIVLNANGTYTASWYPILIGEHTLMVTQAGEEMLVRPPWRVNVTSSEVSLNETTIAGNGITGGIVGEFMFVELRVMDEQRNPLPNYTKSVMTILSEDLQDTVLNLAPYESAQGMLKANYTLSNVGVFYLRVWLDGAEMHSSPFRVVITPSLPPSVQQAKLTGDLSSIDISFGDETDRGGSQLRSNEDCVEFLAPVTLALVGVQPKCVWTNDRTLRVYFGSSPSILDADQVMIKSGVIRRRDLPSHAAAAVLPLKLPTVLPSPTAVLSMPSAIGTCGTLHLDASLSFGGGGRVMRYSYGAEAVGTASMYVKGALEAAVLRSESAGDPSSVMLDAAMFEPGREYIFQLTVTNFVGVSDTVQTRVVKYDYALPTLQIAGGSSQRVYRRNLVQMDAQVAPIDEECGARRVMPATEPLVFRWRQTKGPPLLDMYFPSVDGYQAYKASVSTRYLYIPPRTLEIGFIYEFELAVSSSVNPALVVASAVSLEVLGSPLGAAFIGGDQVVTGAAEVMLKMAMVDPDSMATPFQYVWSCRNVGDPTKGCFQPGDIPVQMYENLAIVTVAPGLLAPGNYAFDVEVTKAPLVDGRRVRVSSNITVLPQATSSGTTPLIAPPATLKLNPSARLSFRNLAGSGAAWSCTMGDLTEPGLLEAVALGSLTGEYLSLPPGTLSQGQQVTFMLAPGGPSGLSSKVTVVTNEAPWGGRVTVSPTTGVQADTLFTVTLLDWVDQPHDLPFTYTFYYRFLDEASAVTGGERMLVSRQTSNKVLVYLPTGRIQLVGRVYDAYDTFATAVSGEVLVRGPAGGRRMLQQEVNSAFVRAATQLVSGKLLPAMGVMALSQALQLADIYGLSYGVGSVDVEPDCPGTVNALAPLHEQVLEQVSEVRRLQTPSSTLLTQLNCVTHPLLTGAPYVSQKSIELVLMGLERDVATLKAYDWVQLEEQAADCITETLDNLLAVLQSACDGRNETQLARVRSILSLLIEAMSTTLYPGMPPRRIEKRYVVLEVNLGEINRTVQIELPGLIVETSPFEDSCNTPIVGAAVFRDGANPLPLGSVSDPRFASLPGMLHVKSLTCPNMTTTGEIKLQMEFTRQLPESSGAQPRVPRIQFWQEETEWSQAGLQSSFVRYLSTVTTTYAYMPAGALHLMVYYDEAVSPPLPSPPPLPLSPSPPPSPPPLSPRVPMPPPPPQKDDEEELIFVTPGFIIGVSTVIVFIAAIWLMFKWVVRHRKKVRQSQLPTQQPAQLAPAWGSPAGEHKIQAEVDPFGARFDPFGDGRLLGTEKDRLPDIETDLLVESPSASPTVLTLPPDESFVWHGRQRSGGGASPPERVLFNNASSSPGYPTSGAARRLDYNGG